MRAVKTDFNNKSSLLRYGYVNSIISYDIPLWWLSPKATQVEEERCEGHNKCTI